MPKDKRIQLSNQRGLRVSTADLSCPKANTQPSVRWISAVITPLCARYRLSRRNQIIAKHLADEHLLFCPYAGSASTTPAIHVRYLDRRSKEVRDEVNEIFV